MWQFKLFELFKCNSEIWCNTTLALLLNYPLLRCYNDFMILHEGRGRKKGERLQGCLGVRWSDGGQDGKVLVHERRQQQGVGRPQVRTWATELHILDWISPTPQPQCHLGVERVNPAYTAEDRSCTVYCTVDVPAIVLSAAERSDIYPHHPWDTASLHHPSPLTKAELTTCPLPTSNLNFSLGLKMRDGWVS